MLDFLGIGAQKGGTTWLSHNLKRHPQIAFAAKKELHFWDKHFELGIPWYLSQFPDQKGKISGEVTPAYAILPLEKIRLIRDLNPKLRVFYILRDPRARAWSGALMALTKAQKEFEETDDQWFIDQFTRKRQASLMRGDYETCIRQWREVFDPDQILLLRFADIKRRPHELLQELAVHLGIDPEFYRPERGNVIVERIGFPTPRKSPRPALKKVLHELYDARIESLYNYLGERWFENESEEWKRAA